MKNYKKLTLNLMLCTIVGFTFLFLSTAFATCPDNLIGYWKMDKPKGGGGYKDEINGNTGIAEGNFTDPSPDGVVNLCAGFDGSTTKIDIPANHLYNWLSDESFSIEFWLKADGTPLSSNQVLVGRDDSATDLHWWVGMDVSGLVSFILNDKNGNGEDLKGVGTINLSDGAWHHVVAVRDNSTDTNSVYVDGVLQGSVAYDYSAGFGSDKKINLGYLNLSSFYRFNGLMDEVALYDRALSPDEISDHYTTSQDGIDYCNGSDPDGFTPFPDDTISLWPLDEASGSSSYVDTFGDNDGAGKGSLNAASGTVNGAQNFDGFSSGIDIAPSKTFNWLSNESFSIEFWVQTDVGVPGSNQVVVGRDDAATQLHWWVGLNADGYASFNLTDISGNGERIVGNKTVLSNGSWHHVVAVRDNSQETNYLYVDGVLEGSVQNNYTAGFGSDTKNINLGYLNLGSFYYYDGLLDEVALYDRALPLSEIQSHYTAGQGGEGVTSLRPEPTADAGEDQSDVAELSTVTLDGSGSTPGYDGTTIAAYLWEQTDGTTVTIVDADKAMASFTAPDVTDEEQLTFQLTVTSDDGQSSSDEVVITVVEGESDSTGGDGDSGGCFISALF